MANYNRYYDQQSSKDYYEYNLWENSHFNNGFHLQTLKGEHNEMVQVLESSEDELSGGENEKRLEKKDCVQKRVITRAEILEDPETYCRMYLCDNDNYEDIASVPAEHPSEYDITPATSDHQSGYDWSKTNWSKGGTHHANTNQTTTHEKPMNTSTKTASEEKKLDSTKMVSNYSNKYFTEGTMPPNYSNKNMSFSTNNQSNTGAIPSTSNSKSPLKERKDTSAGKKGYKENSVQKRISKALAQPITISKATSMMKRMGWKGGPLGKNSDGIAEPIAPDATYITKKGFGHEDRPEKERKRETKKREPQPKKKAKLSGKPNNVHKKEKLPKGMPKDKKDLVTTNSLIEILHFVRNSREIEVSFDCKLTGMERKVIHNTVQFIIDDTQELETIDFDNKYHIKLLELIYESNHFNLVTESEGERKKRQLTLYKEAKDNTYLVTPDDLLPQDEENDVTDDVIQIDDTNVYKNTVNQTKVSESYEIVAENKNKEPDKSIQNESKSIQNESKSIQNDYKSRQNESKSIQINAKANEGSNPFLKSIERIQTTNINEKSEELKNLENTSMQIDSEINITETLKGYFLEFLNENVYTEFRFLGPFSEEQLDKINSFINNVYNCIYKGEGLEGFEEILEKINGEEELYFEVKEDSDGSVVIYKCKTEVSIPIE